VESRYLLKGSSLENVPFIRSLIGNLLLAFQTTTDKADGRVFDKFEVTSTAIQSAMHEGSCSHA